MLVRRYVGSRCGVSSRLTSDCSRSASPMITCVYSISCGAVELALEQLRRAADAAERILDLVREAADQLAVRLLLLEQPLLARDLQLLVDVAELDAAARDRRASIGDTVQVRCSLRLARRRRARAPARCTTRRDVTRLVDRRRERRAVAEELARRVADELRARQLEQVLGGRIGVGHAPSRVEHQHRRRRAGRGPRARRSTSSGAGDGKETELHDDTPHRARRCARESMLQT